MNQATSPAEDDKLSFLKEPVSAVKRREQTELDRLLEKSGKSVVLFGAGNLGKRSLRCLRSIGVEPLAITDNNQSIWGTQIDGCNVVSPAEAAKNFGATALFIVTIWNTRHLYGETRRTLQSLGCNSLSSMAPIYWRFSEEFLPYFSQDLSHKVYEDADRVIAASSLWADVQSSRQFDAQIRSRALGDWSGFESFDSGECYFPADLFKFSNKESFVDCGAFDGDTILAFLKLCPPDFESILAIEADAVSYPALTSCVSQLAPGIQQKVIAKYCAVGSQPGMVRFESDGSVDAKIGEHGTTEVECFRLDDLLSGSCPTHIKMDIEGAEYDTLQGAREVITKCRPILAVCVYHIQSDIWRIPLLIREFVPDYRFYLRMYEGDGWQTVTYAVPPERCIS